MPRVPTWIRTSAALLTLLLGASPSYSASVPTVVGQCSPTTVAKIGNRLQDGLTGRSVAGSGSTVSYANGGYQVSYDQLPGIDHSRSGDPITLCLVVLPQSCPKGDDRGKIYLAINLRTNVSEHSCGSA